jgi:hypothetical protein
MTRSLVAAVFLLLIVVATTRAADQVKVGAFTFNAPDGWTKVTPSSPMRKAQFDIGVGMARGEVNFFHFGMGQGGSAQDNVARWFAQFPGSEAKRKTNEVQAGPAKITFAMTEGTFSSGMPGGPTKPMEDYALCGAILPSADGDVFVKMTGPKAVVEGAKEAFMKMVMEAAQAGVKKT